MAFTQNLFSINQPENFPSSEWSQDSFLLAQHRGKIKRILDRDGGQSQSTRVTWPIDPIDMQVFAEILHVTKVLPWLFGSTNCILKYLISCHLDGEILTEPAKGDQTLQLELTHLDKMFLLEKG